MNLYLRICASMRTLFMIFGALFLVILTFDSDNSRH